MRRRRQTSGAVRLRRHAWVLQEMAVRVQIRRTDGATQWTKNPTMFVTVMQGLLVGQPTSGRVQSADHARPSWNLSRIEQRDWNKPRADRTRIPVRSCCRLGSGRCSTSMAGHGSCVQIVSQACRAVSPAVAGSSGLGVFARASPTWPLHVSSLSLNVPVPWQVKRNESPRVMGVGGRGCRIVELVADDALSEVASEMVENRLPLCVALGAVYTSRSPAADAADPHLVPS